MFFAKREVQPKKSFRLDPQTPQNEYYEEISARLGIVQVILYLTLFAFVVISILTHTEFLTYENFYYFFKDLNASSKTVDFLESDYLAYQVDENQSFTLYRGGLAVAGETSVTLFTPTGKESVYQSVSYRNPVAVGSGKYLLVYESGGYEYSIFNSYTRISVGTAEEPIMDAAVSETGIFALVTSSSDYRSVISVYDNRFDLMSQNFKNGYLMDLNFNSKGNLLAILSSNQIEGHFATELSVWDPEKGESKFTKEISQSLGVSATFSDAGGVFVTTSDSFYYLTSTGKLQNQYLFEGQKITYADYGSDGVTLTLKKSENSLENLLIVFDKTGNIVYNESVGQSVLGIARFESFVFVLRNGSAERIDWNRKETKSLSVDGIGGKLLVTGKSGVFLCYPQKALFLKF